jgi:hypothetical protein
MQETLAICVWDSLSNSSGVYGNYAIFLFHGILDLAIKGVTKDWLCSKKDDGWGTDFAVISTVNEKFQTL